MKPIKVLSPEEALELHHERKPYTAVIGNIERPTCFIEVNNDFLGVSFLDRLLREKLTYQFQEIEPSVLFLTMATYRDFEQESLKIEKGRNYTFSSDGKVRIREEIFAPKYSCKTATTIGDIKKNYEKYPSFGDYSSLIKIER
jgi:hypothetical protein